MARVLIDVGHPAHIHLFKNAANRWLDSGHDVLFTALDREMIIELLEKLKFSYEVTYRRIGGRRALLKELPIRTWRTYQIARRFRPDLFFSVGSPTVGIPALLLRKPYMAVNDTETAREQHAVFLPFASVILTPDVFYVDFGKKHVRYAGYHELAYLHPDIYEPNPSILGDLGLRADEPYYVVRFVAWNATHDVGERGLDIETKRDLIELLSQHGRVVLSTEDDIPDEFNGLITTFPQDRMQDILAFAQMYVGEGNTMASEAAVLGTPAIRVNTMDLGYCRDLQDRGLMFQLLDRTEILDKVHELLDMHDSDSYFDERRKAMLSNRVSTTDIFVNWGELLLKNPRMTSSS